MNLVLIISVILILLFLTPLIPIHIAFDKEVKKRLSFSKDLKYFNHLDFPRLKFKSHSFPSHQGQILKGGFYNYDLHDSKKLIIFVPGYGPGHLAYTGVIEQLCKLGYEVFSFDLTGTGHSEGKNFIGYTQGLKDIQYAFASLKGMPSYAKKSWILVGHSLGGFVALNSGNSKQYPIEKVVSLSGFNNVIDIFKTQREQFNRWHFYFSLYMLLRYGFKAMLMSFQSVKKSSNRYLIMMGGQDQIVPVKENFKIFHSIESQRVQLVELPNKFHNPYLTQAGERYFIETFLLERPKVMQSKDRQKIKAFHDGIDYALATQNDVNVFKIIDKFLKG
jgi:alpha-beta hydrolase superfamily lysophospholipase